MHDRTTRSMKPGTQSDGNALCSQVLRIEHQLDRIGPGSKCEFDDPRAQLMPNATPSLGFEDRHSEVDGSRCAPRTGLRQPHNTIADWFDRTEQNIVYGVKARSVGCHSGVAESAVKATVTRHHIEA